MKNKQLLMRILVDEESLLGKVAAIEKKAEELRFEAMCLRDTISCIHCKGEEEKKPEE